MTATTSNTENVSTNGAAGGTTAIAAGGNLIHRKTILYHTYFRLFRNVTAPFSLAYVMEYNLHKINRHPNGVCHPHTPGTANTNASFGSAKHNNSAEGSLNASLVGNSNFLDLYSLSTNSQRLSLPTRNYYSFYNNTNSGNSVSNKKKNMSKTTVGEKLESIGQSVVEWVGRKTICSTLTTRRMETGLDEPRGEEGSSVSPSTYVATNLHQHYTPPHTEHPSHGDASPDHNHHNTNNNNTPHSRASPYVSHYTAQLPPLRTTVVHCTPLDYVSGRAIVRYLGYLSQHCVREITNVSTASEQSKCITKVEFEMQTLMSSWVLLLGGNTLLNHEIIYHEISFSEASGGTCFVFATVRGDAALTSNQVRSAVATSINAAATTGLPQEESDYESSSSMSSASDRDE
ncbi:hypothetical protein AGDE_15636 [Angomonas deanei]|nr:hypothetical protein AGDE_15636 [Angomonas deanei]|eukprot:EPY18720.1 hypothetical protein AGDE_15636 [Angomonas deanei]